jgi:outer membrane protein, heavy metal efflux system
MRSISRIWPFTLPFALVCATLHPDAASAQSSHDHHPTPAGRVLVLSLEQALRWGAERAPEVQQARAPRGALRDARQAANPAVTQLPHVQLQLGPRFSDRSIGPELAVSALQPISLSNLGQHQARVARAAERVNDAEVASAELASAERAGLLWVALALADTTLQLRQTALSQAEELLVLAERRTAAGATDATEAALARSDVASARSLVIEAEGLHFSAELELRYAIGAPADARLEAAALPSPPSASAPPETKRALSRHPDLRAAESRSTLAHEQIAYQTAQQVPSMSLGLQYQRESGGDQIVSALAVLPLPFARPWAYHEAQSRAQYDAARATATRLRTQAQFELEQAEHEVTHAQGLHDHLVTSALPPVREAHRVALAQYAAGATDFTQVSLIRQRLLAVEEQQARALADVHGAHLRWLRSSGQLTQASSP